MQLSSPVSSDRKDPPIPRLIEEDDGDRPSITEVNGTVARFEMAFDPAPQDRFAFGPPTLQRLPSLLFLGFAGMLGLMTIIAHQSPPGSSLYRFIVTENRTPLVIIIALTAVATFVRAGLRGVIVTRDSVETRTLAMGFPRVKRFRWAQIDRVLVDEHDVIFELWNGSYERLPRVRDAEKMVDLIARVATGRGRTVTRIDSVKKP